MIDALLNLFAREWPIAEHLHNPVAVANAPGIFLLRYAVLRLPHLPPCFACNETANCRFIQVGAACKLSRVIRGYY